jgi:hypothetical protein
VVDFLSDRGIEETTVLEIGGGIGEVDVELLRRGSRAVTNLEISTRYEEQAAQLLDGTGLGDGSPADSWISPALQTRSSRPVWSCSTGWCAATRMASDCFPRPPPIPGTSWSSLTRRARPSPG